MWRFEPATVRLYGGLFSLKMSSYASRNVTLLLFKYGQRSGAFYLASYLVLTTAMQDAGSVKWANYSNSRHAHRDYWMWTRSLQ